MNDNSFEEGLYLALLIWLTFWTFFLVISIIIAIVVMLSYYKIFQKAGRDDAWAAFIPIYNTMVLLDIIKRPWWQILMYLIPLYGVYLAIVDYNRLSKFFGRSEGFTVGLVLLPFVFFPILGFGDNQYISDALPDLREGVL